MEDKYNVFFIIGYERRADNGNFVDITEFQIIADTYEEALKTAKEKHQKPEYYLKMVVQNFMPK